MTRAVVTGASGMLGLHVVQALQAAGVQVRAFVRPTSDVGRLSDWPVELVRGSLGDPEAARRAVAGTDWVIHAAGLLPLGSPEVANGNPRPYHIVNVESTETWLRAALAAGVERFVYASSASVYSGEARSPIVESARLDPIFEYGASKLEAEGRVRAYQARGLPATIVRPCVIYGPGDRYFVPVALRLARLPLLPLVNGGRNLFDLVHALDVAQLIVLACQTAAGAGAVYNAGAGEPLSLRETFDALRHVTGFGPRIIDIPPFVLEWLAWAARRPAALVLPGAEAFLTPAGVADLSRDAHLDIRRARQELGYAPQFNLALGLASTLRPRSHESESPM